MAIHPARPTPAWLIGALAVAVSALVVVARQVAVPVGSATYPVLVAAIAASAVLVGTGRTLEAGWITWRRTMTGLAVAALAVPGGGAIAALASAAGPYTPVAWASAVLAGTAHLPLLAAFSLLPLLAVRYLGRGSTRTPAAAVLGLLGAAVLSFAAFFDDFAPLAAAPLITWGPGVVVGTVLNAVFLATVLLGPLVALLAARRVTPEAMRRLATVGASSLAGAALVMLCGTVAPSEGTAAATLVYGGMYVALAVVAVCSSRALKVRLPEVDAEAVPPGPVDPGRLRPLTGRETEILGLLAEGLSNAGIAARLVLSQRTVDAHLRSVFSKLDLPDSPQDNRRVHAVLAFQEGARSLRRTG